MLPERLDTCCSELVEQDERALPPGLDWLQLAQLLPRLELLLALQLLVQLAALLLALVEPVL